MNTENSRLIINDATIGDMEIIQTINEASDYIADWVGWKTPADYAFKTLTEGNLPPGGCKANFSAKIMRLRATNEAAGVAELYRGFPTVETLLLGWLFILPQYQQQGYAREALSIITEDAKSQGFHKIRLGVHLKNWPALRFWHAAGFDKVAGIIGDKVFSEKTFASIILEKYLDEH